MGRLQVLVGVGTTRGMEHKVVMEGWHRRHRMGTMYQGLKVDTGYTEGMEDMRIRAHHHLLPHLCIPHPCKADEEEDRGRN